MKHWCFRCLANTCDVLFQSQPYKSIDTRALQLSRSTVTQRSKVLAEDLTQQLCRNIAECECFSLQLDKSTDTNDKPSCEILMVFTDMTAKEELLKLPMKECTRGEFIFQSFKNFMEETTSSQCVNCVQYWWLFVTYAHYRCQFVCAIPRGYITLSISVMHCVI